MAQEDVRLGERRLTIDFAAWLDDVRLPRERFFRQGLIVLDANVLLDLYRITPKARRHVLDAFDRVADRLWVPHQAALEFSRNRKKTVIDRTSSFKQTRQMLRAAEANAVGVLESAVGKLLDQRERNGTTREWDVEGAGLDRASLRARLMGVMEPALAELEKLTAEYDLSPADMQAADNLLLQIDDILRGHIGTPYPAAQLRSLVEEAHSFRFPNRIPPGFLDADKETPLRAAGDFLLWRQIIDRTALMEDESRLVIVITKETKGDWWVLEEKRPRGPRPELVQELYDSTGAYLLLLSLNEFMEGVRKHLSLQVPDQTLHELREVSEDIEDLLPDAFRSPAAEPKLLDLSPREFERLIHYLLIRLGYDVDTLALPFVTDFFLIDRRGGTARTVIADAKRWRGPVGSDIVLQLRGALDVTGAQSALLITTGSITAAAQEAAQNAPIELVDGVKLVQLLAKIGIRATI